MAQTVRELRRLRAQAVYQCNIDEVERIDKQITSKSKPKKKRIKTPSECGKTIEQKIIKSQNDKMEKVHNSVVSSMESYKNDLSLLKQKQKKEMDELVSEYYMMLQREEKRRYRDVHVQMNHAAQLANTKQYVYARRVKFGAEELQTELLEKTKKEIKALFELKRQQMLNRHTKEAEKLLEYHMLNMCGGVTNRPVIT